MNMIAKREEGKSKTPLTSLESSPISSQITYDESIKKVLFAPTENTTRDNDGEKKKAYVFFISFLTLDS